MLDLLRADEMDVAVEAAGGEDFSLPRDDVGAGSDHDGDAGLNVGIAGLADRRDHAFLDRDVGFDDAPVIDDQCIGDHSVGRALGVGDLRLAHAVADYLAAAELHLLAIGGEILFHLDDEVGIGQPHPVPGGGPEHVGIDGTLDFYGHEMLQPSNRRLFEAVRNGQHRSSWLPLSPTLPRKGGGSATVVRMASAIMALPLGAAWPGLSMDEFPPPLRGRVRE